MFNRGYADGAFNRFDLSEALARRLNNARRAVEHLDADYLLNSSTDSLVAEIVSELDVEPPMLVWDEAEQLETSEAEVDVSGNLRYVVFDRSRPAMVPAARVTIAVPVTGGAEMLSGQPTTNTMRSWPNTGVVDGELRVWMAWPNPTADAIRKWWDGERRSITEQMGYIQRDIERWRSQLPGSITKVVESRRARLLRDRGLDGSIGLKIRTRGARPRPVPVKRRKVATTRVRRQQDSAAFHPEPELDDRTYEEILDITCAFGRGLERSPRVAQKYDEEELRDQIIMHLNGHFEGEAGGELFNGSGKTDILVRQDNKNVFIGECKFWEGQKKFTEAIDQLTGYMVWRDTKAAIILFIRQKDPSAAIEKAIAAIRSHPQYKRDGRVSPDKEAYTNYVLRHRDDDQREIRLALVPVLVRPEP